jgi:predicted glycosyltransferase
MKILYATQATGNGHLSRARDIISILEKRGDLDVLISGTQADLSMDYPVKYKLKGLSFVFGKKGKMDLLDTFLQTNLIKFAAEVKNLPVEDYDLIISDVLGEFLYKNYAPVSKEYGFHYEQFDHNIFTPVIRKQVREANISNKGHYTVYLPAYGDAEIFNFLSTFSNTKWEVFSKHNHSAFKLQNVHIRPLDNTAFIESMVSSAGILCGAGFETTSEALFLNKKVMVIPVSNQYEQLCNAEVLKKLGVPVLKQLHSKYVSQIADWIEMGQPIHINYPDITENIINMIINNHMATSKVIDYSWNERQFGLGSISPA